MKLKLESLKYIILILTLCLSQSGFGQAVGDYRTNATGTWNWTTVANWQRCETAGTWVGATSTTYPGQNAGTGIVTIQNNTNVTLTASPPNVIGSLILFTGANNTSLQFTGNPILIVTGNVSLQTPTANNIERRIYLDAGTLSCGSIDFNSAGGNNTRDCWVRISNGLLDVNGNINFNGVAANRVHIDFTAAGLIQIEGSISSNNFIPSPLAGVGSTIEYDNAGGQTVFAMTYENLILSGSGAKTTTGVTVNGMLSMEGTATASAALTYGAAASLRYMGSASQTTGIEFPASWTGTGGIFIENANGVTLNAAKNLNARQLTIGGTISNSILYDGGYQLTATGTLNLTSGTFSLGSATAATTWPNFGTRNISAGTTVEYSSGIAQTISPTPAYRNLIYSGAGTKTVAAGSTLSAAENWNVGSPATLTTTANATIGGNITGTGAITVGSGTISVFGDFSNSGAFTCGTGMVNYNGNDQQVKGATYNNLTISNGGTKSLLTLANIGGTLTLTSGILQLGNNNLTITNNAAGAISGAFSSTAMIATDGTGYLIKNAASAQTLYPVGSGGYYSPVSLTITAGGTTGTVNIRAVPTTSLGTGFISKYWDVYSTVGGKTITATFNYSSSEGSVASSAWFKGAGAWQTPPPTGTVSLGAYSATITGTTNITSTNTWWSIGVPNTYYSYRSGSWTDPGTWTSDPGGTTQVGTTIPGNNDYVVILSGRTVSLPGNIASTGHDITINGGGFLDLSTYQFTSPILALSGQGTLRIASSYFPATITNNFVNTGGGTTEFYNGVNYNLPSQSIYNNLTINKNSATAIQVTNISLNGSLYVQNGTFQINNTTAQRLQLTINGDVIVDAAGFITVGTGVTNSTTNPLSPSGITGGYLNYYELHSHRIIINGDFTNNGSVRFTNLNYPVFNAFPSTTLGATTGFATVYFKGATDNTLICNGQTDFYNLILDKGIDQTFTLTIQPSSYSNFKLFGANISGGETGGINPDLKKALWIRTGTLVLKGLSVIPSLSEGAAGGNPVSDFVIPANGALKLDGPDVIVLVTADDYGEVNIAYGVAGGTGTINGVNVATNPQALMVYGKLQVNNGYLSTRESAGIIYNNVASGQIEINGGVVDAKQMRENGTTGSGTSFTQTDGTFILRGRFERPVAYSSISALSNTAVTLSARAANGTSGAYGTFNINNASNIFSMSGGTIKIYDVCGTVAPIYALDIRSSTANTNVTNGIFEILPTHAAVGDATPQLIYSVAAPFGNLTINRGAGCTSDVQLNTYPLTIFNNLLITSGSLLANNLDVTIGGNFNVSATGTYNSGTNTTTFNGSANQTFTLDGTINNGAAGLRNMVVNKSAGTINLSGAQVSLTIQGSFDLTQGTLDDGGKIVYIAGNINNSGTHISTPGTGVIQLNGTVVQTIGGDGNGIFDNLELNNNNAAAAPVSLNANITVNGTLTFSQNKLFNINTYNLRLNASSSIVNVGALRYIQTGGNAGDGGVTKYYSSSAPSFIFPVGAPTITPARAVKYTPATIALNGAATAYGYITVVPVGFEHPATKVNGFSLTYFWRVKSGGFTLGSATVTHGYTYGAADMTGITASECIAARYNQSNYTWTTGTINDVDETNFIIGEAGTGTFLENINFIDGDYTAGDNVGQNPFAAPTIYYSRQNGLWSNLATWSLTGHTVTNPPAVVPGINDIVIIGGNDSVFLNTNNTVPNTGVQNCASLQIEQGSALDIGYNPGCNFSLVQSHPNGNGNFRLTTSWTSGSTYTFPSGDFSDFNINLGTTELYSTNPAAGTTYWLPNGVLTYGNLILSPLGGSNIIFPNNDLTIYGNCITRGQNADSWFCPTWDVNYPTAPTVRVAKTITIKGNLDIQGGALIWYGNGALAQNFVIDGDVTVSTLSALYVWSGATNQSMAIGGSLINNTDGLTHGLTTTSKCDFTNIPVTFFSSTSASITNTGGDPSTIFSLVTVNKGTSQSSTLTCDIAGTLTTPANNWLTLQNGTLRYIRTGDLAISTTSTFTIPNTAGLYINTPSDINIANSNSNANDLYLNGKLTILNGRVFVGRETGADNNNNDIEYSGGGYSEIDMQGGTLFVNGQIRRNPSTTNGILKYSQSGTSAVIINGQNANTTCAKLEVFNIGSSFNMSNTSTLTIVRGGGGNTYGDLYLRPELSNVSGGTIIFSQTPAIGAVADAVQNYQLDANVAVNNISITGKTAATARNATVKLMINPLTLNGNLTLSNANSIFDANTTYNINVTIKGDFTNSGTYNHFNNTTFFTGGIQNISGTSAIDFYNLSVNPVTSLTIGGNALVNNDLNLLSGSLICNTFKVTVKGNVVNNATYTDNNGGIVLSNGTSEHHLSGSGTFGQLELNDVNGAKIDNAITLQKNLVLTQGVLNISQYLFTLGQNSNIIGSGFGPSKMITSDGVYSDVGITKVFGTGATVFTFPLGVAGKYTPAVLTVNANGTVGYVRLNNINSSHPAVFDPANVLNYFWEVESSGITGFEGNLVLNYLAGDVNGGPESDYVEARLINPGTSWSKGATGADNVDEINHHITFNFSAGTSNLSGEYTAGNDPAIPDNIPVYTSNADGNWNTPGIWTQTAGDSYTLTGGPNGFIVIVNHEVTADANYCQAYQTTINDKLKVVSPYYGHNLGTVDGSGTLYLESGTFPAGRFTSFLDCASNSTIEYGGTGSYAIIADLYNIIPNILFSGTGIRILPNKDLTICNLLDINGPTVDNSTYNRKLTIQGSMVLNSGAFNSGTGAGATVTFSGSAVQSLAGFSGSNSLNNLEINNGSGLTLAGQVDLTGNLLLTNGIITTTSTNILTINNTSVNCVTPAGGSSTSYISGPLVKKLNQGDTYFQFPIGNAVALGNRLLLRATQTGTLAWTAEYINPSSLNTFVLPLTAVNERAYWNISTPSGGQAFVNLQWVPSSDLTPLMTQNGISDMRVAEHNGTDWTELASTATGDDYNGSAETSSRVTIPAGGSRNYTLACINTPKPRIRLSPTGPICGAAGIPVTLSASYTIFSPYTIIYTIDGVPQTDLTPASFPFTMPTGALGGIYQLTGFTYNYPAGTPQTGVFDVISVTTYTVPTTADAGSDQSLCGATSATLAANNPVVGSGLWSILSGTGGTVVTPTIPTSDFNGTNGSTYSLRWTISNGTCTSSEDVTISFPLLPVQPGAFTNSQSSVCQSQTGVMYTVPNDASVTYSWSYSGTGATINGTTNSVTVDFDATSTSGSINVTATNGCGTSAPRSIAVTINVLPTITLGANPSVCQGSITASLPYSATSGSPDQYSIVYSAGALTEGFINILNSALPGSPVTLVVPVAAAANIYNADLTVRNNTSTCESSNYAITITINAIPVPTLTGDDTICQSDVIVYTTEAGMSNYSWVITDIDPTASHTVLAGGGAGDNSVTIRWTGYEDHRVSVNYLNANSCTAVTPTLMDIWVIKLPETGPTYHIPNTP